MAAPEYTLHLSIMMPRLMDWLGSWHATCPAAGSHDRSIRRWQRTDEPFFVEEEREKRLESLFEADLDQQDSRDRATAAGAEFQVTGW